MPVERYVYDALRRQGVRVDDLTDDQRERAVDAPKSHVGLRGKALAEYITDGSSLGEQTDRASNERIIREAQQRTERRTMAQEKNGGGGRASAYPDDVRKAVKIVYEIKGTRNGAPGPKRHVHIREVVAKELGKDEGAVSAGDLVFISGFGSRAELEAVGAGETDRESLKTLRPLAEKLDSSPFCRARNLAAILAAWARQIDEKKRP